MKIKLAGIGLSRKQKVLSIVSLGLLIVLPLILVAVKQRQELRRGATEDGGVIKLTIISDDTTLERFSSSEAFVYLTSTKNTQILVAGVDLYFPSDVFLVSPVSCNNSEFPLTVKNQVDGNTVRLICGRQIGQAPLALSQGQTINLGKIGLQIKGNAPLGDVSVVLDRINIPELTAYKNLGFNISKTHYTITAPSVSPAPLISPTPVSTETPLIPTKTFHSDPIERPNVYQHP